ncbi:hypothetical protein D9V28_11980 [Mycetocola zhadangensis]|uniref:LPXTG cell wall anchor domain-containing protein n=2 Tax=Mycetocola zhadangensis TaxID=1164595 RepID=A0A3L7IWS6_9MICO|nr:hypothetical protein D9V28_11980 [Mycetocola zhadangensis]
MAIFAVPAAATAYGPASNGTVVGDVTAGGNVTINFAAGAFVGGESVTFVISGNGGVTIAAFKAATDDAVKTANADGSVGAVAALPTNASGSYNVTATGASGRIGTATLTVAAADAGSGLPNTGSEVPVLALWTAGGALALGAALIAVMTIVRRQRLSQD